MKAFRKVGKEPELSFLLRNYKYRNMRDDRGEGHVKTEAEVGE